jgi:hypothetical protein
VMKQAPMKWRRCVHPDGKVRVDEQPETVVYRCEDCLRRRVKRRDDGGEKWVLVKDWDEAWKKSEEIEDESRE